MVYFEVFGSVLLVSLISLLGIVTLSFNKARLNQILLFLVSLSAGALLGDAFLHLIPEVTEEAGFTLELSFAILLGILLSFALERIIHWRHCHAPTGEGHPHTFAYMNLLGDFIHNFLDGLIIAASYMASIPVGIATTMAVLMHEIPQEIGDFGVLVHGGFSRRKAICYNFLTALSAVAGAAIALTMGSLVQGAEILILGLAAGGFIYIASSDLIPELHRSASCESVPSKAVIQLFFISLGIFAMYLLILLE